MAQILAAFCDGTWARLKAERSPVEAKGLGQAGAETNAALLYRVARDSLGPGRCAYFAGVGTRGDAFWGGFAGVGLDAIVLGVYRWICERYAFGCAVHLFGFSRGAYAARSVAGLIRRLGFARPAMVERALTLYRRRLPSDAPALRAFREAHAIAWVEPEGDGLRLVDRQGRQAAHAIRFIGVWDTVGALGVPEGFPLAGLLNRGVRFHDAALSPCVALAAHALAADERRRAFEATPWTNAGALNAAAGATRCAQVWFPGDHGSVGGGGPERRLSDVALLWMAERAHAADLPLHLEHPELQRARDNADPLRGPLLNAPRPPLALLARRDRRIMQASDDVHDAALARMIADPGYRPGPLRPAWPPCSTV